MVRGHARVCLGLLVVVPAASGGSTGGAAPVARIGMNYFDGWADPVSSFHYDGLVRSGVNGQFSQYRPLSGWRDNTLASMRVSLRTAQYGLQSHGRTWDRNGPEVDRLDAIEADFSRLLQGVLVDAEGRPISLSTTDFHSALGQIRDLLAESGVLREIVEALLREMAGR